MRCQNCGWDNQPGATSCTKCGQLLPVNAAPPAPAEESRPVASAAADRATMVFKHGEMPSPQQMQTIVSAKVTNCGNCGYPVAGNDTHCPACGALLSQPQPNNVQEPVKPAVAQPAPVAPEPVKKTVMQAKARMEQPTVRFHPGDTPVQPAAQPPRAEQATVRFRPGEVPEQFAPATPEPVLAPAPVPEPIPTPEPVKQGTFIPVPESNQPVAPTIVTEDGHWYIEPCADAPVFLQVTRRMEIQPGDVVKVQGQLFRFELS